MADKSVDGNIFSDLDMSNGLYGPYWIDTQTAIIVYIDFMGDVQFSRTTDGGVNWSATEIIDGSAKNMSCWFDQETPGDSGTKVHVTWLDSTGVEGANEAFYVNIDVSDGAQGTIRTIDNTLTINGPYEEENRIAITKTIGGNLLMALSTQVEIECYRSVDSGVNWTDRSDPFETGNQEDWLLLYPANTADNNDVCGIFWDRSTNEISMKMYDDSENTWTETIISGSMSDDSQHINMDAAVRHSDSHILFAAHSNDDSSTDDLMTWDLTPNSITSPTVTAKTNIFTDQAESAQTSVLINQQNDDVYVSHLKGGTWQNLTDIVFHKSDDRMGTWGSEQAYNETQDDNILVHGGRTIGDSGGRVQWSWFNDDLTEIFVNLVNDIEISATGEAPTTTNPKVKVSGTFSTKTIKTKISGTFTEKPIKVKVSGSFQ